MFSETTLYYIKFKLDKLSRGSLDSLSITFDTLMSLSRERAKAAHRLSGGELRPRWEDVLTIQRRLEAQAQGLQDFVSSL